MLSHSTTRPTKEESEWISRVIRYGCICCLDCGYSGSEPVEYHHIVEGNRRLGHLFGLPLCRGHHRRIWSKRQTLLIPAERRVSIADGIKAFIAAFGSQRGLWEILRDHVGLTVEWPTSKMLPRRLA